jgi:hypothetical protein
VGTDGKSREDMSRKVDTNETDQETSGTGLKTTKNLQFTIAAKRQRRGTRLRQGEKKSGRQERNSILNQRREKSSNANTQISFVELDSSLIKRCRSYTMLKGYEVVS